MIDGKNVLLALFDKDTKFHNEGEWDNNFKLRRPESVFMGRDGCNLETFTLAKCQDKLKG